MQRLRMPLVPKRTLFGYLALLVMLLFVATSGVGQTQKEVGMVRIAEIEIDRAYVEQYREILKEEAKSSVGLEPGVIAIFPMFEKADPTQVRILEIYASREAYESHLKTPHFTRYKTTTANMVKSLKLVEMEALDPDSMTAIFEKLKKRE